MDILKRLLTYLKPYTRLLVMAQVFILLMQATSLILPRLMQRAIDFGIQARDFQRLWPMAVGVLVLSTLSALFTLANIRCAEFAALRTIRDLRNRMYDHLQHLSFSFHDEQQTGQLLTRATGDIDSLRQFLGFGVAQIVSGVLFFFGALVMCWLTDWKLTLLSLWVIPVLGLRSFRFGQRIRPAFESMREQVAEMTAVLQENVTGVRVVKAYGREDYEIERFGGKVRQVLQRYLEMVRLWAFYFPSQEFVTAVGTAVVLWYGGRQHLLGQLTVGELIQFYLYLGMMAFPIRMLGVSVNVMMQAVAAGNRIFEILDRQPDIASLEQPTDRPRIRGHVRFENVTFRYETGDAVLQEVTMEAKPGQVIGILGATGSGKSTFINLIPRFYDVTEGRITVDGADVREFSLPELRRQIGIVLQEPFLFAATIRENIAYGRPDATLEEVEAAARIADIHDYIVSLPDGYDTEVGERGVTLSGGQKQRVAIARALLLDPRILILDASTSSVDTATEHRIQQALDAAVAGRTTFIIAQRISSVKNADHIVVFDGGRVAEEGSHEDLLARGGLYAEMCELQGVMRDT
jgi:ATP-binding cassette subfamily B protein